MKKTTKRGWTFSEAVTQGCAFSVNGIVTQFAHTAQQAANDAALVFGRGATVTVDRVLPGSRPGSEIVESVGSFVIGAGCPKCGEAPASQSSNLCGRALMGRRCA